MRFLPQLRLLDDASRCVNGNRFTVPSIACTGQVHWGPENLLAVEVAFKAFREKKERFCSCW